MTWVKDHLNILVSNPYLCKLTINNKHDKYIIDKYVVIHSRRINYQ